MITKQFTGVTPERWASLKQVFANEAHVQIEHDEGSDSTHGIDFSWLLASAVLTVTINVPKFGWILKAAGLHTEDDVMGKFAAWINGVK
jgi:hypothetical protein